MSKAAGAGTTRRQFLAVSGLAAGGLLAGCGPTQRRDSRPNILLILADDLGFSDLGCCGGEIKTPNLDALARTGTRFTQFYNCARCCPTRASLLTGLYPHRAGIGHMITPQRDLEGYRGTLREDTVTIPEALKQAGYRTLMAGKWHLAEPGPVERGFDEFYGLVHGFDSFWDEPKYTRLPEGRPYRQYGEGNFYATDAITDHALDFLSDAAKQPEPWFLYLAYTAPHFPLHAPKEATDAYMDTYSVGWDVIREQRFERQKQMGLLPQVATLPPREIIGPNRVTDLDGTAMEQNPAWNTLLSARQTDLARRMAVYAAMVEIMDRNIGRVVNQLSEAGQLDNTLILFFSDNGACAEWKPFGFDIQSGPDNILHEGEALNTMGLPGTYHSYGSAWANASNTPLRLYKHYTAEGGISTPCIVHWPGGGIPAGALRHEPAHIVDVLPTFLELARAEYPAIIRNRSSLPLAGTSLLPLYQGASVEHDVIFFEHESHRAVRHGKWKLLGLGSTGAWELYDIESDRDERRNLASAEPDRVRAMAAQWEEWAVRDKALPWPWEPQWPIAASE